MVMVMNRHPGWASRRRRTSLRRPPVGNQGWRGWWRPQPSAPDSSSVANGVALVHGARLAQIACSARQKATSTHLVTRNAEEEPPRAFSPWIWRRTGLELRQLVVTEQGAGSPHQHTPASLEEVVDIIYFEGDLLVDRTSCHDSEGNCADDDVVAARQRSSSAAQRAHPRRESLSVRPSWQSATRATRPGPLKDLAPAGHCRPVVLRTHICLLIEMSTVNLAIDPRRSVNRIPVVLS